MKVGHIVISFRPISELKYEEINFMEMGLWKCGFFFSSAKARLLPIFD